MRLNDCANKFWFGCVSASSASRLCIADIFNDSIYQQRKLILIWIDMLSIGEMNEREKTSVDNEQQHWNISRLKPTTNRKEKKQPKNRMRVWKLTTCWSDMEYARWSGETDMTHVSQRTISLFSLCANQEKTFQTPTPSRWRGEKKEENVIDNRISRFKHTVQTSFRMLGTSITVICVSDQMFFFFNIGIANNSIQSMKLEKIRWKIARWTMVFFINVWRNMNVEEMLTFGDVDWGTC